MTTLRPMSDAPIGTFVIAYHKATGEPLPCKVLPPDQFPNKRAHPEWAAYLADATGSCERGYVRLEHLEGFVEIPLRSAEGAQS